ncbi:MAG: DMT family transporter, partial [bacterium]
MTSNRKQSIVAELGLVYATVIWGTTFVVVKEALEFINPLTLVAWRFLLAASVLAIWLLLRRKPLLSNWRPGVTLGILLWLIYAPQTIGLEITTASNSAFITGMFVAFVPLFDWIFLRQRFGPSRIVSVLLCLGGLWLLTGGIVNANLGDL